MWKKPEKFNGLLLQTFLYKVNISRFGLIVIWKQCIIMSNVFVM